MSKFFKFDQNNILHLIFEIIKSLSNKRKKQILFSLIIILICGLTEFISLGAVLPFIGILVDPNSLWENSFVKENAINFGYSSPEQLILPITLIFVFSAIFSTLLRLFNLWINTRLNAIIGSDLSREVYRKIICQPYEIHIERNSSNVINATMSNTSRAVNVITSFLQLISSAVISFSIIICIILVDLKVALSLVLLFGFLYLTLASAIKTKLNSNSKNISRFNKLFIKSIQEGIGAIRDVILNGNQNFYIKECYKENRSLRIIQCENKFLTNFSKYLFEGIGIITIALIGIILVYQNKNSTQILSLLGAIGLGTQKLLPALQEIFRSWGLIKSNSEDLKIVSNILKEPEINSLGYTQKLNLKNSIKLNSIKFRYNGNKNYVIKGINLEIKKGERIGLIGMTGGGKSTLIDILSGLLKPTYGELIIDGKNLYDNKFPARVNSWRASISHVPQSIYLSDCSIAENIALGIPKNLINFEKVKKCAEKAHIAEFIRNTPYGYNTFIGERGVKISGGQRQRIGIARALYRESEILIFDEATSALDDETERSIISSISNLSRKLTIIMIAHRLTTLHNCDKIIKIKQGLIIDEGSPKDIFKLNA